VSFLELINLRKTYPDGTEAVRGVDLGIDEGEFVVLLGPSGCGKTTTLRMIAGLEQPTGGTVRLAGRDVTGLRPGQRDVGFVFQFFALYPHMTVAENIAFPLANEGVARRECRRRVQEVAEGMGIVELLARYPGQLSGGDQQRVALARAIVRRPAVYLMDEPLGTLDAGQRLSMREFIRTRQLEMKVATIYVTHDQEEAMALADRIVVMKDGRARQIASPMTVYDDPADLFVAGFVGSPGMNFLPGEIRDEDGRSIFVARANNARAIALPTRTETGPATLGIRPEHVLPDSDGPLQGTVVMDEYQGVCRSVHIDVGLDQALIARVAPGGDHGTGDPVRVRLDVDHVCLFRGESGERI
jgi:ABC-type sugar transport system ATPase subunit